MKSLVRLLVIVAALTASHELRAQTVLVTGGQIRGAMLDKGGAVFKGIPYAAPPVGGLRWREPAPVKAWSGVREATAFGAMCAQSPGFVLNPVVTAKEDCLYLNIWTPEWPSRSRKPVMVWFVGGGNIYDASSEPIYDGGTLARRGVVVVSFNYRLGSFGFFSHPALTRESPHHASGNQGILDQIAALKWVRDNVAKFGGDPDNVTIFGNSAGSLDASVLMTSPLAKGLFRRVIGQSGAVILVGDPQTLAEAEKRGEGFAANWKLPAGGSLKDMRAVSADDILKTDGYSDAAVREAISGYFPNLGITVDGYVFPKKPADVFAAGEEFRVPMMLGSNARERVPGTRPPDDLRKAIDGTYGPLAGRAETSYVSAVDSLYGTPAEQWATDTSFRCSAVAQLTWHAGAGNSSFQFEFARVPSGREALGATHGSERFYVFGTLDQGMFRPGSPVRANVVDEQVSDAMQQYWTNFAKTGNPNGGGLPMWPKFDPTSRAYIQFTDQGPVAKEGLRRPYCDLFIENTRRLMAK